MPKESYFASLASQDIQFDILTEHQLLWSRFTFVAGTLSSNEGSCASMKDSEDTDPKKVKNKTATRALILEDLQQLTKYTKKWVDRSFILAKTIMK